MLMSGGSNEPLDLKRKKKHLYSVFLNFFCFDPLKYKLEHLDPKNKQEDEDDDNIEKFTT